MPSSVVTQGRLFGTFISQNPYCLIPAIDLALWREQAGWFRKFYPVNSRDRHKKTPSLFRTDEG
jgi:hypothetical protein